MDGGGIVTISDVGILKHALCYCLICGQCEAPLPLQTARQQRIPHLLEIMGRIKYDDESPLPFGAVKTILWSSGILDKSNSIRPRLIEAPSKIIYATVNPYDLSSPTVLRVRHKSWPDEMFLIGKKAAGPLNKVKPWKWKCIICWAVLGHYPHNSP